VTYGSGGSAARDWSDERTFDHPEITRIPPPYRSVGPV
jgi:hypothetical protein